MKNGTTVGIVGAGTIATTAHIPVLRAIPQIQIAWITDTHEKIGRAVANNNSVRFASLGNGIETLPPCDVVLLAIPLGRRDVYFDHFASAQSAVLAEKPLANNASEHAKVAVQFASWQLAVGFQRRFYATTALLQSIIQSNVFGPLLGIHIAEGGRVLRTGGFGTYQDEPTVNGGGIVKNLGCHSLDLSLWLTQARHFRLHDRLVIWDSSTDRRAQAEIELIDVGGIPGHNCMLHWTVSWLDDQPNCYEFEFAGALLRCPIAPSDYVDLLGKDHRELSRCQTPRASGATTSAQAFYLEWNDLFGALENKRAPVQSAMSCLSTAELMDQVLSRTI